jgi:rfaE bifunctional protein kinase chain/domain
VKMERVKEILKKINTVKIAVYGDFCIDAYWILDPRGSEISVETGLKGEAVARHYYTLGGASNIVANIAALQPANIQVLGVIGDDIYGHELLRQFNLLNVNTNALVVQKENFDTYTFAKRYVNEKEQPRIDFGFYNKRSQTTDKKLLKSLQRVIQQCDVVIFNQQVPGSITNKKFIREANNLFRQFNDKIVLLDSRHYGNQFQYVYHKINDLEAAAMNNVDVQQDDKIPMEDVEHYAQKVFQKFKKPTIITRGERGMVVIADDGIKAFAGIPLRKKLDTVGAGDTVMSAIALCLGAEISIYEAARFANLAAAVTVQKRFQTGTASGDEILEICKSIDYNLLSGQSGSDLK